jgi:pimeloyl-ACP methyl ester carboxylesterase
VTVTTGRTVPPYDDSWVLLLHGMGCGPWVWQEVQDALPEHLHPVPAAIAGHRGGTALRISSETSPSEQMVDDLEDQLDALGLGQVHIVGNSLGGWLALRLAERGRARSVLCLAPAGGWRAGSIGERLIVSRFVLGHRIARRLSRSPRLLTRAHIRRAVMAPVVHHPTRITFDRVHSFVNDMAECQALRDAIGHAAARRLRPIARVGAPTTIVWCGADRVLSGRWARAGFSHLAARTLELPNLGHVPMLDAPDTVAALISDSCATATADAS